MSDSSTIVSANEDEPILDQNQPSTSRQADLNELSIRNLANKSKGTKRKRTPARKTGKKKPEAARSRQRGTKEIRTRRRVAKWTSLRHNGPILPKPYKRVPKRVKLLYNNRRMKLSKKAEEAAGFFSLFSEKRCGTTFKRNFFQDWRERMTNQEKQKITDLEKCNFKFFKKYYESKRKLTEKQKEKNRRDNKLHGFCSLDGRAEKCINFRIEEPGLFRGRGAHPNSGKITSRLTAEDVIINVERGYAVPAPPGEGWKDVIHNNTVTWLACWDEVVTNKMKYMRLASSAKSEGIIVKKKFEQARLLKGKITEIRENYKKESKSTDKLKQQTALALFFIDQLSIRAGNEKGGQSADTVGCCTLRREHIELHQQKGGQEKVVSLKFKGKDSIVYKKDLPVPAPIFQSLQRLLQGKKRDEDIFDRLDTKILNEYLNDIMKGLTGKVFRTLNACKKLEEMLNRDTNESMTEAEKVWVYRNAILGVADLCNHQRATPRNYKEALKKLKKKVSTKKRQIREMQRKLRTAKNNGNSRDSQRQEDLLAKLKDDLVTLEREVKYKEATQNVAVSTCMINYLDPRISVAWSKRWKIPIEKIFNKTQLEKFSWAMKTRQSFVF